MSSALSNMSGKWGLSKLFWFVLSGYLTVVPNCTLSCLPQKVKRFRIYQAVLIRDISVHLDPVVWKKSKLQTCWCGSQSDGWSSMTVNRRSPAQLKQSRWTTLRFALCSATSLEEAPSSSFILTSRLSKWWMHHYASLISQRQFVPVMHFGTKCLVLLF